MSIFACTGARAGARAQKLCTTQEPGARRDRHIVCFLQGGFLRLCSRAAGAAVGDRDARDGRGAAPSWHAQAPTDFFNTRVNCLLNAICTQIRFCLKDLCESCVDANNAGARVCHRHLTRRARGLAPCPPGGGKGTLHTHIYTYPTKGALAVCTSSNGTGSGMAPPAITRMSAWLKRVVNKVQP